RRTIGVIVGAALLSWLLLQERIRPKVMIWTLISVSALLLGMQIMLENRSVGYATLIEKSDFEVDISRVRVDDNFLRLSQIVEFFPDVHPYVNLQPIIFALIRPVPRAIWPGKPIDPGYDLTELVGLRGVSLTHSIVGELYAMHGLFAVFLGGFVL